MVVIGLTGSIGTGKSTVAEFLARRGAVVINADEVGHHAFLPNTPIWEEVVAAFGRDILGEGEEIDRKRLGEIVFNAPEKLQLLNQIMHPRMKDMMAAQIARLREEGVEVVVVEAALLIEAGWAGLADQVWVTTASEDTVIRRLASRNGLSEEQVRARVRSQMPPEEKLGYADVAVDTNCTLAEVEEKVAQLWDSLRASAIEK